MTNTQSVTTPGDPRHPDHEDWLLALGKATYAASKVAGICFDILRVFGDIESANMYSDPLGKLLERLRHLETTGPSLPLLGEFIVSIESSKQARNDLLHALPVKDGLHRRTTQDLSYVKNFYTVEDLQQAADIMSETFDKGSRVLYYDGGAAVKAWQARA